MSDDISVTEADGVVYVVVCTCNDPCPMHGPTPAGAAPRDEARDRTGEIEQYWFGQGPTCILCAQPMPCSCVETGHVDWLIAEISRLRSVAAAPRADPYEAALRQLSATFQTRWDGGANGLERSIWCEAKVNVDEAIRAAARAPGREP